MFPHFYYEKMKCKPPDGFKKVMVTTPPARSENLEAPKQKKHHFYLEAKVLSGDCKQRAEYATPWRSLQSFICMPQDDKILAQHRAFKEVQPHHSTIAGHRTQNLNQS